MSILIKGMEMPKNGCQDCIIVKRSWKGDICPFLKREVTGNVERGGFHTDCPLVPVPPHGDLIDRKYAIATACSGRIRTLPTTEDGENWIRVEEVRESIKDAPTVIPAEEGE